MEGSGSVTTREHASQIDRIIVNMHKLSHLTIQLQSLNKGFDNPRYYCSSIWLLCRLFVGIHHSTYLQPLLDKKHK
jgi:hypothetical protein